VKAEKLLAKLINSPLNDTFTELCNALEYMGFKLRGQEGSHRVYSREGVFENISIQNDRGMAKPYQVKLVLKIARKYNLLGDE
jgi:hypothetical protein